MEVIPLINEGLQQEKKWKKTKSSDVSRNKIKGGSWGGE